MKPRIVAMMQGMESHGGIQRNSRTVCTMLSRYAAQHAMALDILSFTDPDGWRDPRFVDRPVRGCNGNRALFVARAVAALARPYDLALVGQIDFGPIMLLPHLFRPRVPVLALTYGIEVWRPLPAHKRAGLHIADRVATISMDTAEKLVAVQQIAPERIAVIPCTMDADFLGQIAAWQASGLPSIHSHMLTVSRMHAHDADKGIDHTIAALAAVRKHVPDVRYTIIGDGADRPRLEQVARDCGVADRVHFVGRVSDEQMHAHLSGCDVFVLPSRKEGFGIVFLEAMAYGKPVIAGAHGGSPEVVIHGETGLLVEHGNRTTLAAALALLLSDPRLRQHMGEQGRRRVQTTYSYVNFETGFEQALDELLNRDSSLKKHEHRI